MTSLTLCAEKGGCAGRLLFMLRTLHLMSGLPDCTDFALVKVKVLGLGRQ